MKPRHAAALALRKCERCGNVGKHRWIDDLLRFRMNSGRTRDGSLWWAEVKTEIPHYTYRGEIDESSDEFYS